MRVTVGGQTLAATVQTGGTWGVSASALPTGSYDVVASITDAAQNTGSATQALTIASGGEPEVHYRPDAAIRPVPGRFVGVGIYVASDQRVTRLLRGSARTVRFEVRVTNRGDAPERMTILATPRNREFAVTYLADGRNVTRAVTAGTYRTIGLAPGDSAGLVMTVTRTRAADSGDSRMFEVRADSTRAPAPDTVAAVVRVR